ncbi:YrvL family regulatory protein [Solibacillus sp. FSL K6-1523]|uniref:YrvL family regulatory protein n=1 Tax=Solibacillus sp. FSL K6-1523 TaxID=2921471 RepID=UPI0030F88B29
MNKLKSIFGILIALFAFLVIIGIVIAVEVFALILLGFTYDSWQSFALFIIVFGIVEFILSSFMQNFVALKMQSHHAFHKFWGQLLISITLMLIAVNVMESISIPVMGAVIYAIITAVLYHIIDVVEKKNQKETDA